MRTGGMFELAVLTMHQPRGDMSSPDTEQSPPPASDTRVEPVFSPHAHQNASETPTKQTKGTRWTKGLWTIPLKTLAFREVVGQGWFAIKGQTDNRIRAVSNLNTHQLFVDTGKKLSMGQMLSMVGEEMSKHRRQQASDVRATGAGDQQRGVNTPLTAETEGQISRVSAH